MEQVFVCICFFCLGFFLNDTPAGGAQVSNIVGATAIAVAGLLASFFLLHQAPGMVVALVSSLLLGDTIAYGASFFKG